MMVIPVRCRSLDGSTARACSGTSKRRGIHGVDDRPKEKFEGANAFFQKVIAHVLLLFLGHGQSWLPMNALFSHKPHKQPQGASMSTVLGLAPDQSWCSVRTLSVFSPKGDEAWMVSPTMDAGQKWVDAF
jgi:hypothetical protein